MTKFKYKEPMLYWAYGSNLNVAAMKERCPGAIKFAPLFVPDGALVFRGVADVVFRPDDGYDVPGGLWWITEENERALDAYEGVRVGFYIKRYMTLQVRTKRGKPETKKCLFYQMSMSKGIMPPSEYYLDVIAEGYRDFGLPLSVLDQALIASWDEKKVTPRLAERHKRRGGQLARVLEVE